LQNSRAILMAGAGVIYILRNAAFKDSIIKIGMSGWDADTRARQLSNATGVPGPFEVLYEQEVADAGLAEKLIHDRLRDARVSRDREFFQLPLANAVRVVFEVCMRVNRDRLPNARALLLWFTTADSSLLKEILGRYQGGDTVIVVGFRNANGECQIRLPRSASIRWDAKVLEDLREMPGLYEATVVTPEASRVIFRYDPVHGRLARGA
jgi:hypothetical protein